MIKNAPYERLHLFVNCTLMAREMGLLSSIVIVKTTLKLHLFLSPTEVLHPGPICQQPKTDPE